MRNLSGEALHTYYKDYIAREGANESIKQLMKAHMEVAKARGQFEQFFGKGGIAGTSGDDARFAMKKFEHEGESGSTYGYAMGNLHEFIAQAFKNPTFQRILNNIKMEGSKKSIWQTIKDAVGKMLGIPVKDQSILAHVLEHGVDLTNTTRGRAYIENDPMHRVYPAPKDKGSHGAEPNKESHLDDTTQEKQGFLRGFGAAFDRVKEVSNTLSDAFHKWDATRGKILAIGTTAGHDLSKYKQSDLNRVMELHREAFRGEKQTLSAKLTPAQQEISDIMSKYYLKMADERDSAGMRIHGRMGSKNKFYVPDMLNDKTLKVLTERASSDEAQHLKNIWAEHIVNESGGEVPIEVARKDIADYVDAIGGRENNYRSIEFGALRRAQGYGLPEGMRETDPLRTLSKYSSRAANDLAMFRELETKDNIASKLKLINPKTGKIPPSPDGSDALSAALQVKDAMKLVTGSYRGQMSTSTPKIAAVVRTMNNALLGTATGLRDTASIPQNMLPYVHRLSDFAVIAKGAMNFRNEARAALESGAVQPNLDKMTFDSVQESADTFSRVANMVATGLRKFQGREWLENTNREITFSIGKELAKHNIEGAIAGNKKSIDFLKKFGLLVEGDVTTLKGADREAALNQMAKNFVDRNQGTYGGRGIPIWMVESQFAPFYALQKWSMEKSNVIYKDVYKPFMDGSNRLPMLTYALGTLVTGAGIQQLNELLSNRKGQDPTVKETMEHPDPKSIAAELATIMQLGSYAGIIGDAAKVTSDIGLRGKAPRNIVSFPTATAAIDLEKRVGDVMTAIREGEDPWAVLKQFSVDMATHNVQLARLVANHTINETDVERSDKMRDMRAFNELEGKPASAIPTSNQYAGLASRDFKHETDPAKAGADMKDLLHRAIMDSQGNPAELQRQLRGLKSNSYNTMPNMKNNPVEFMKYMNFIKSTQGDEAAQELLQDYIKQNAVNSAKSSMVP